MTVQERIKELENKIVELKITQKNIRGVGDILYYSTLILNMEKELSELKEIQ